MVDLTFFARLTLFVCLTVFDRLTVFVCLCPSLSGSVRLTLFVRLTVFVCFCPSNPLFSSNRQCPFKRHFSSDRHCLYYCICFCPSNRHFLSKRLCPSNSFCLSFYSYPFLSVSLFFVRLNIIVRLIVFFRFYPPNSVRHCPSNRLCPSDSLCATMFVNENSDTKETSWAAKSKSTIVHSPIRSDAYMTRRLVIRRI